MKRGEVLRAIEKIAKQKGLTVTYTEGGKHTKVTVGDKQTTVARHSDIPEYTAKAIIKFIGEAK